jgi:hypothetical protein
VGGFEEGWRCHGSASGRGEREPVDTCIVARALDYEGLPIRTNEHEQGMHKVNC